MGRIKMNKYLKSIDYTDILEEAKKYYKSETLDQIHSIEVEYKEDIPENERIPGLIEMTKLEAYNFWERIQILGEVPIDKIPKIILGAEDFDLPLMNDYKKINSEILEILNHPWLSEEDKTKKIKETIEKGTSNKRTIGYYNVSTKIIYVCYRKTSREHNEYDHFGFFRCTLSHELFHAYHHIRSNIPFEENNFESSCIIEGLAEFFTYWYIQKHINKWDSNMNYYSIKEMERKRKEWRRNYYKNDPYAYAYRFFGNNPHFTLSEKFKAVFYKSLEDVYAAYRM